MYQLSLGTPRSSSATPTVWLRCQHAASNWTIEYTELWHQLCKPSTTRTIDCTIGIHRANHWQRLTINLNAATTAFDYKSPTTRRTIDWPRRRSAICLRSAGDAWRLSRLRYPFWNHQLHAIIDCETLFLLFKSLNHDFLNHDLPFSLSNYRPHSGETISLSPYKFAWQIYPTNLANAQTNRRLRQCILFSPNAPALIKTAATLTSS